MTIFTPSHDKRLPPWFRISMSTNRRFVQVRNRIREGNLHTVCEGAACPNRNECWNAGTATFLILGNRCTRNCGFCNISSGRPDAPAHNEPERVAAAVEALRLDYAVITSVTRDDLPDGGAGIFADTIRAIRRTSPGCKVEVLVPDFQGARISLETVLQSAPDVLNHNIETVPSLYSRVRPHSDFYRSLMLLARSKERGLVTKSGIMIGLGEDRDELRETLYSLQQAGCDIVTIGQYLQPNRSALPVVRYYLPEEFEGIRSEALTLGLKHVLAGPRMRSSYHTVHHGEVSRLHDNRTDREGHGSDQE